MVVDIRRFYFRSQAEIRLCERNRTPEALFSVTRSENCPDLHYVRTEGNKLVGLLQTDGACIDNGGERPYAGAAFVYGPRTQYTTGWVEIELGAENATSNRAELKAVIEALAYRSWCLEFDKLVIATDSEYVVRGCTEWYRVWEAGGWRTAHHELVKNWDLWQELMRRIDFTDQMGSEVEFWKIPREWNSKADGAAKCAAAAKAAKPYNTSQQKMYLGCLTVV